jgi:hypothetical protein
MKWKDLTPEQENVLAILRERFGIENYFLAFLPLEFVL